MVTNKEFNQFLRDHRAFKRYVFNVCHGKPAMIPQTNKMTEKICDPFIWYQTKEGYLYWLKLDKKWRKYVSNHL